MIRPAIAPPRQVVAPARIRAVPLTHIQHRRAPVVVWGYVPWYSGDDGWYSGYGTPSSSSYDNWTYVAPSEQNPSDTNPIRTVTRGLAVWAAERRLIRFLRQMTAVSAL